MRASRSVWSSKTALISPNRSSTCANLAFMSSRSDSIFVSVLASSHSIFASSDSICVSIFASSVPNRVLKLSASQHADVDCSSERKDMKFTLSWC